MDEPLLNFITARKALIREKFKYIIVVPAPAYATVATPTPVVQETSE